MDMIITFPGGRKVNAEVQGHTVRTDQKAEEGGEGSAPEPYSLFLASIGTCAGIYILTFCQTRGIPTENIRIVQSHEFDDERHRTRKIRLDIQVPPDFPEKYHKALVKSADLCTVKRAIMNPPEFEIVTTVH
jgi:putative redox protein